MVNRLDSLSLALGEPRSPLNKRMKPLETALCKDCAARIEDQELQFREYHAACGHLIATGKDESVTEAGTLFCGKCWDEIRRPFKGGK